MNNKTDINVKYVSPLKKICMTIGELPSSYLETMSYYEMLVWFTEFLKNQVIPTVNNNAEAVQELQTLYEELRTYVNNYFDNLDVQDEINNKLDQMLEDGVLEQIIEQYLQSTALWCFDTVADMKEATNLIDGSFAKTMGYHSINDNGGATYKIVEDEPATGHYETLDSGLYALLIIDEVMNSKQLGMEENTDITTQLQEFFDLAYTNRNKEFDLIGGNYSISNTITINPYCKITLKGITFITDNNENEITFNVISNADEVTNDTQGMTQLFDNTNGCIIFNNNKREIEKICLSITSTSSTPAKRINCNIKGIQISNYDIGISLNTFNTYFMEFEKDEISFCRIGLYIGKNGAVNNSGENISFKKCLITRCDCAIYFKTGIRADFIQNSFDFNSCVLYIPLNNSSREVNFTRCWIEGCGFKNVDNNNITSFESFNGIVYAEDDASWYDKNIVNFDNCQICHLKGKRTSTLCSGSSLLLTLTNNVIWYDEAVAREESFGDLPMKQLLLADNVRNVTMKNNNFKLTSHFISSSNNSLINPFLTNETLDTTGSTIGAITNDYFENFDIDSLGAATGTTIKKVQVNGATCIELTPPYSGASSNITLISKNFYPINNAYRIYANAGLKGFKATNQTYVNFGLKFYDGEFNLIDTKAIGSSYRDNTTGIDSTKFMFGYKMEDCYHDSIPKNAVYCKFTYKLIALNGGGTSWDQPVQYTGFYAIME